MGSGLYNVKVTELSATSITLELEIIHPDAGLSVNNEYTAIFALRLLYEPATDIDVESDDPFATKSVGPLGDAFSEDDILSESWGKEHASDYIMSAVVTAATDLPGLPPVGTKATLKITMTDPKWLVHLSLGQIWESAAF